MIDPERLRPDFDRLWPKLGKGVLNFGPTHAKEDVWDEIASGRAQFWIAESSAMVTQIITHPTGFTEIRGWLAAGDLNEIRQMEAHVSEWAKGVGCKRVILMGRKAWLRAFPGYKGIAVILEKEL